MFVDAGLFPVPPRRDHGKRTQRLDRGDDLGRVASLVCDHGFGLLAFQQADCLGIFGNLSGRDAEGYRQAIFVSQQMDLGAQSTSGNAPEPCLRSPFLRPVAAC
jgi:hypothetical protein